MQLASLSAFLLVSAIVYVLLVLSVVLITRAERSDLNSCTACFTALHTFFLDVRVSVQ